MKRALISLVVLAAVGGGGFYYFNRGPANAASEGAAAGQNPGGRGNQGNDSERA